MTTTGRAIGSAWGLFVSMGLLMIGNGLMGVLLGVRSEVEGFSTGITGLVMAGYFAGFLAGSQVAPRFMARVGHIRVFTGLAAVVSVVALIHALWVTPVPWIVLRVVFGFGMAGLYVVVESWLNDTVTVGNRGRVMAVYMVVSMGGIGVGQLLLGVGEPVETTLFLIAAALMSLAVVPISLSFGEAPPFALPPRRGAGEIFAAAPLGIVGALFTGIANGALLGMAGVYATRVGLSPSRTAIFVAVAAIGSVALQWPIGHMSDVIGRRRSILGVTAAAAIVGAVAAGLSPDGLPMLVAMFVFGGLSFPMYSLSLSHVIDVLPPGQAVTGSMAIVFVTGVGAIFGPLSASAAMTLFGPDGFFWTMAAVHGAVGVYAVLGMIRTPLLEGLTPEPYVAVPARSTILLRQLRPNGKRAKDAAAPSPDAAPE